jgi:hypothetical protein
VASISRSPGGPPHTGIPIDHRGVITTSWNCSSLNSPNEASLVYITQYGALHAVLSRAGWIDIAPSKTINSVHADGFHAAFHSGRTNKADRPERSVRPWASPVLFSQGCSST